MNTEDKTMDYAPEWSLEYLVVFLAGAGVFWFLSWGVHRLLSWWHSGPKVDLITMATATEERGKWRIERLFYLTKSRRSVRYYWTGTGWTREREQARIFDTQNSAYSNYLDAQAEHAAAERRRSDAGDADERR